MPNGYKGPERRTHSNDHDNLIIMIEILDNHVKNFDRHTDSYKDHIKDDKIQFESINSKLQKILNYKYMILGGFIVVQIILKIFWKS